MLLEKAEKYCSVTYRYIQFLVRAAYIHRNVQEMESKSALSPEDAKQQDSPLSAELEDKDGVFYDAEEAPVGENYRYYGTQERVVLYTLGCTMVDTVE